MMWSLCNKAESASILKSSCQKTSGFAESDLAESSQWLLGSLSGGTLPEQPATSGAGPAPQTSAAPAPSGPSAGEISGGQGDIQWYLEEVNAWESEGHRFRQYSLTVRNTGAAAVSAWSVTLDLGEAFELQNSWNGNYAPSGTALTVTPMDYNASIPAGGSAGNIGFILKS